MSAAASPTAAHGVRPGEPAPELRVELISGGTYVLGEQAPERFTMVVFFRGLHCPVCRGQLRELDRRLDELTERGVAVLAVSGETRERTERLRDGWKLERLALAYGLTEEQMRRWGLWLPAFVIASRHAASGADPTRLETGAIAFAAIGVAGLAGAVAAGLFADRVGRIAATSAAMLGSAACCLLSPLAFSAPIAVLAGALLVWGAIVIADSAQFSAAVTELAEPRYAGSALTLQLALGFALTIASIRLVPAAADVVGWRYALLPLAAGPLAGTVAMFRLRAIRAL